MPDDAAQQILSPVDADNSVKAAAWQAFKDSTDEKDFAQRIGDVSLPQNVKAQLWEAKKSGATGPAQTDFGASLPSNMSISAAPAPSGIREKAERWAQNVMDDIKHGTDVTGVGTVLHKMGAHGVYSGNSEAVGDFMASLPLGILRATKGGAEITQEGKTWEGTKDVVGGTLQAAQIPTAFMGGPATETGAEAVSTAAGKVFGDAGKAGALFNKVAAAAKDTPIEVTDEMYAALKQAKELAASGAKGLPRAVSKFFNRVNDVDEELTWDEARRFYSNVSRLSANEYQSMAPQMAAAVSKFARAFDDSLRAAADASGAGDEYNQAMQLFAKAKSWQKFGSNLWNTVKASAVPAAAGALAGGTAAKVLQTLYGARP